jgi:hypothetical protein
MNRSGNDQSGERNDLHVGGRWLDLLRRVANGLGLLSEHLSIHLGHFQQAKVRMPLV